MEQQPLTYPLIPVRDGIVFPGTENVLAFGREKSVEAIKSAMDGNKQVVLVMQKNASIDEPEPADLYQVGVLASVKNVVTGDKGEITALVRGEEKVAIETYVQTEPYCVVETSHVSDILVEDEEVHAMIKHISSQIKRAINLGKTIDFVFLMNILNVHNPLDFSNQVAMVIDLREHERQEVLEEHNLKLRLKKMVEYINREIKILEIEQNISSKTNKKFEKGMKENFLREKMRTIEEELGGEGEDKEINEYRLKIKKAKMPKDVEEKAIKELRKLSQMSQFNPETSYVRTYLDWLCDVPWTSSDAVAKIDITKAETVLNEDHYGLKKIKERILEYLAVIELKKRQEKELSKKKGKKNPLARREHQPTILCFAGPPGVGKTSLGRSIARALGREFVKMSLGGVRDEAEIRGHRRTYVGAMPGRIIQGIKQAKSTTPVFMLDEIDKIGNDHRGDPSAALLEALDPEQNHAFSDHYLEVPYDLSDVFFITTANMLDSIPDALRDRLEIIHFAGYTEDEKFAIAKQYLVSKQENAHGVAHDVVTLDDATLRLIVQRYTREAGVRELERQIATIYRKVAREIVEKDVKKTAITKKNIDTYLGPYKYNSQMIEEKDAVGITTGLAWTSVGGDILFIEAATMPGKGALVLTGHLGDVMKESCQAALSYIRSRWEMFRLPKDIFEKTDIHIHVPEGAVPKDGPSAGVAIVTAMISALAQIPVRRDVGMTGEITLRGRVLEIGGVKEKVIAAHRAHIKTVILPRNNKKDLEEVPQVVKDEVEFIFVDHIEDVLAQALRFNKTTHASFKSLLTKAAPVGKKAAN